MPGATQTLTKRGFRRDVRLFLTALVGFLVVLIFVLVLMLESLASRAQLAQHERWQAVADAITARLERIETKSLPAQLEQIRSEYRIVSISVGDITAGTAGGETVAVHRVLPAGPLRILFDAAEVEAARRVGRMTIAISTAAAGVGLVLLFLYLPRIVDPIERMLDEAEALGTRAEGVDETRYLVETFRTTIETMKQQKTELERLHEAQRARASELELLTATLTRSLSSGFIALDPRSSIVDLNAAAREILGIDGNATGRTVGALLPGSEFAAIVSRAFRSGESLSRIEIAHRDRLIGLATVPLVNEQGKSLGMMLLFTDVTDVRRLEERVRGQQALADLGEMSAGIAHEFRNALSTILGYLRLASRTDIADEARTRIAAAEQEAVSLSASVDALLRFARPMQLEFGSVDLRPLIEDILARFSQRDPSIAFHCVAPCEGVVAGDTAALRALFENIIRNAAEAIGSRAGTVTVTLAAAEEVTVEVEDDGVGVDPAEIPRLLLPFQSNRPGGVGLGLPLANKIAILHGGSLSMMSEAGRGTKVTVTLPHPGRAPVDTKSINSGAPRLSPFRAHQA